MTPMIDAAAYDRLSDENARLTEKLITIERAAYVVYNQVFYDLDVLRPLILEHLGPVVRGAQGQCPELPAESNAVHRATEQKNAPGGDAIDSPSAERDARLAGGIGPAHLPPSRLPATEHIVKDALDAAREHVRPLVERELAGERVGELMDVRLQSRDSAPPTPGAVTRPYSYVEENAVTVVRALNASVAFKAPGVVTREQIRSEILARFPADDDWNTLAAARRYFTVEETAQAILALVAQHESETVAGLRRDLSDSTAQLALDDETIAALRADVARLTGERDRADAAIEARETVMSTQRTRIVALREQSARLGNRLANAEEARDYWKRTSDELAASLRQAHEQTCYRRLERIVASAIEWQDAARDEHGHVVLRSFDLALFDALNEHRYPVTPSTPEPPDA